MRILNGRMQVQVCGFKFENLRVINLGKSDELNIVLSVFEMNDDINEVLPGCNTGSSNISIRSEAEDALGIALQCVIKLSLIFYPILLTRIYLLA